MSLIRRRRRDMPELNTAALPDLIFVVLFFFMIVTHMRTENMMVTYNMPQGKGLVNPGRKTSVIHVHIGTPVNGRPEAATSSSTIQINGRITSLEDLADCLMDEKARMAPEDRVKATVAIKADSKTPMAIITAVKNAIRRAHIQNVFYAGEKVSELRK